MTSNQFRSITAISLVSILTMIPFSNAALPVYAETAPALRTSIIDNMAQVINSGDGATADSNRRSQESTSVTNANTAQVNQHVDARANTGNNEASRNISIGGNAGIIMTGNAAVHTQQGVSGNTNASGIGSQTSGNSSAADTINTGDGARSTSSSDSVRSTVVDNVNNLIVNQSANTSANTGNNKAERNISIGGVAGLILTGNATTDSSFLVAGNGSVALVGGDGNGNGPGSGASIVLANTGDNGLFRSRGSSTNTVSVYNTNAAAVNQSCSSCLAITGGNSADRGISRGGNAGVIQTADATVNALLYAALNTNSTAVSSGGGQGMNASDIVNTGDRAGVSSASDSRLATGVSNTNAAAVRQSVNAVADTGNNHANRNISIGGDAGVIRTGNALINAMTLADVNGNATRIGTIQ